MNLQLLKESAVLIFKVIEGYYKKNIMKKKYCIACGCPSPYTDNLSKKKSTRYIIKEPANPADYSKVFCPYYPKSEINHDAYYINHNVDDSFKDPYSCCNCTHRFINEEHDFMCQYEQLDSDSNNMYYWEPKEKTPDNTIMVSSTYWTCPICKTMQEIRKKETPYKTQKRKET